MLIIIIINYILIIIYIIRLYKYRYKIDRNKKYSEIDESQQPAVWRC